MQAWNADGPLRAAADPMLAGDRQKAVFGRDLTSSGVVPVLLLIENAGDQPIRIRRRWVTLQLPDHDELSADDSAAAVEALSLRESFDWNQAVGVQAERGWGFLGLGLGYLFGEAVDRARNPATPAAWQLGKEMALDPGEHVRGFVYFALSSDVDRAAGGTIRIGFNDSKDDPQPAGMIELRLSTLVPARR